jgi:hypothetical protein
LPDRTQLLDSNGNVREGVARERDAPAGFTPDVLATFEREPELIDVSCELWSPGCPLFPMCDEADLPMAGQDLEIGSLECLFKQYAG